jgi:hypothetical protein
LWPSTRVILQRTAVAGGLALSGPDKWPWQVRVCRCVMPKDEDEFLAAARVELYRKFGAPLADMALERFFIPR